jgi:lysophospholipase L1-like esterase
MRRPIRTALLLLIVRAAGADSAPPPVTVATVGDSVADSTYYGLTGHPALLQKHGVRVVRWSRPVIGLVREDYFHYSSWLRANKDLEPVDLCLVQIGTNDMQSIAGPRKQFYKFGSPDWRSTYAERARTLADTLQHRLCRQVVWIVKPGPSDPTVLSRHQLLISQIQESAIRPLGIPVFRVSALGPDYAEDRTHFTGPFALKCGASVLRLVELWRDLLECRRLSPSPGILLRRASAARGLAPLEPLSD